jgi:hypothetical protein
VQEAAANIIQGIPENFDGIDDETLSWFSIRTYQF